MPASDDNSCVNLPPAVGRPKAKLTGRPWLKYPAWSAGVLGSLFLFFVLLDWIFPLPLQRFTDHTSTLVVAEDGTPLRAFAGPNGVWRYPITLNRVSPYYLQALLHYEDRWFYQHPGVNPLAMIRASWQGLRAGRIISGGSTLTMQVASLMDPHSRTFGGKFKQMFRALQLEWHCSKKEILTYYVNHAPFGGTLEGVEAASRAYLGKTARELSRAEAALLAVLPQSPTRFRPDLHPDRARVARDKVITRLENFGAWTASGGRAARIERVEPRKFVQPMLAPLLAQRVKSARPELPIIHTTINATLQWQMEEKTKNYLAQLPEKSSVAVIVVENKHLAVRAYVGSAQFADQERFGYIDMIRATRSPGSTLKPFLYGLAIEDGLIHSESLLSDIPSEFDGYSPSNFHKQFSGAVSVSEALQQSLNVPAAQLLYHYSPRKFMARLRNGGLKLELPAGDPNLAVILGGAGATLESLVSAYSAFGREGLSGNLRFLVKDPQMEHRMLDAGAAWITRRILESAKRPGLRDTDINLSHLRRLAWKTGTSYGFRDSWAIGVSDEYTVGIWVGRPDGTPMPGHYGAVTAAPLLFEVADSLPRIHAAGMRSEKSAEVTEQAICWPTGTAYTAATPELCHQRRTAWVLNGAVPPTLPDLNEKPWQTRVVDLWVDRKTGRRVDAHCTSTDRVLVTRASWPLSLTPWINGEFKQRSRLPAADRSCGKHRIADANKVKIAGLADATVLRRSGPNAAAPQIELDALGGSGKLYWIINGRHIPSAKVQQKFSYRFDTPGIYRVSVTDDKGNHDSLTLKVIE